ncbi:MAG: DUF1501 domain-containing protein [Rubinisphaera brasiliensis]|uniref:Sulfatase n=1 Tax=Rubinisphaera brasiliensis (strain ATCC 49424 / DSM 5305 / JCM 21570 / IAM 15109 / NBRC 103401 / IFAM 1448) TaxID=756272 RepID=F0SH03_RUBBR|nr:DUF1501 domain-containing protein [Rubinisphaera brasiliensis]ADY59488.1 protein of unknown function DUF1501 [Rubinisphaera brasiliensis DSM 5305]MBR9801188.1 DUF1501 domain-containing protein [bacterium]
MNQFLPTRRSMLQRCGMGFGALTLGTLMQDQMLSSGTAEAASANPMAPKQPHFAPKAKHVIHIFLNGGASQVDTFDPKPALKEWHGKTLDGGNFRTERKTGSIMNTPFKFKKYGESGIEVSEIFSNLGECVDDMTFIRSMHADVPNHEPSLMLMNCGEARLVRPAMGAWVTYGMGTENQNLPGFVVLCPNGYPITESANWRSAFLPGVYQGTHIDPTAKSVDELIEHIKNERIPKPRQRRQLDLLQQLNAKHFQPRQEDNQLEARIQSFELAYRMQMEATDAFDVQREPKHILDMYGEGVHAKQCLMARRLVERGVRFVQLWHGQGQPWDNHDEIEKGHRKLAEQCDQPIAALLKDLKQRGMLEDTLVVCSGEFGRTPVVELPTPGANAGKMNGRDHNHYGFTCWMAGGGVKKGYIHGATDEFGFKAVENKVHVHDLQATILHLLGFDHEQLTYRYSGRDFRLTDVHGHVVTDVIA